jgi:hypothetical protein
MTYHQKLQHNSSKGSRYQGPILTEASVYKHTLLFMVAAGILPGMPREQEGGGCKEKNDHIE